MNQNELSFELVFCDPPPDFDNICEWGILSKFDFYQNKFATSPWRPPHYIDTLVAFTEGMASGLPLIIPIFSLSHSPTEIARKCVCAGHILPAFSSADEFPQGTMVQV